MASSKDFEKIWETYQEDVKTRNISIVDYCQCNGIVYSQFQKWYKKYVSSVNIIPVEDAPTTTDQPLLSASSNPSLSSCTVVYVSIEFSNGLKVCQKSLDYNRLKLLVEKLEGLC